jgi:hypothetical protein
MMHFLSELSDTRGWFFTIAFHLCFRLCHQEGPKKSGVIGIEWNISASGLY